MILDYLVRQSVAGLIAGGVVFGLTRHRRFGQPGPAHLLWNLVLLRLIVPVGWGWDPGISTEIVILPSFAVSQAAGAAPQASTPLPATTSAGLALAWILGAGLTLLWILARRRMAVAGETAPHGILREVGRARDRMRIRRKVSVRMSGTSAAPFVSGWLKPVVVLPAGSDRLDEASLRIVIEHELAHVQRHDDLILQLQLVVCSLFFFHPVAWYALSRATEERERLCDRRVLRQSPAIRPLDYARTIVRLAGDAATVRLASLGGGGLSTRISDLLTGAYRQATPRPVLGVTAVLAVATLSVGGLRPATGHVLPRTSDAVQDTLAIVNPLPGSTVSLAFGRRDPLGDSGRRTHGGIDLRAPIGSPVLAAADGVVEVASGEWAEGSRYGRVVVISHEGSYSTVYAHLQHYSVAEGDSVRAGDTIGAVGATGVVTGPHLHFEVRRTGRRVDPSALAHGW